MSQLEWTVTEGSLALRQALLRARGTFAPYLIFITSCPVGTTPPAFSDVGTEAQGGSTVAPCHTAGA